MLPSVIGGPHEVRSSSRAAQGLLLDFFDLAFIPVLAGISHHEQQPNIKVGPWGPYSDVGALPGQTQKRYAQVVLGSIGTVQTEQQGWIQRYYKI